MGRLVNFFKKFWPVILISLIAFLLRIYKIEDLMYFTYDEEIPAFVGRRMLLFHHIPLIGGATPFGFHLGPYFYWFYALLLGLGKLNPLIWGYAGALLSTVTVFLIFVVGCEYGNKKIGISAAILWAFSLLANIYDRHLWALYWGPLTSLLVLLFLKKIIDGKNKFTIPLGLILALSIHADLSNLIFVLLVIVAWALFKIPITKKTILAFLLIPVFFAPLIYFDFRHDFSNTRPIVGFLKSGKNNPGFSLEKFVQGTSLFTGTTNRLLYQYGDTEISKQYSYCRNYVQEKYNAVPLVFNLIALLILAGFGYWSIKINNKSGWRLIALLLGIYFFGIQLYGTLLKGDIFEHYITGAFPSIFLIIALGISKLPKKLWLLLLAVFVASNLYKLSITKNGLGYKYKREAVEYTMQKVRDAPFSLDSLSTCWKWSGYRYLFIPFGREPVKSYVDPNFGYLYETTPIWEKHPETVVAFVSHDFSPETENYYKRYSLLKSHEKQNAIFGNIEVIILNNESGWFDKQ